MRGRDNSYRMPHLGSRPVPDADATAHSDDLLQRAGRGDTDAFAALYDLLARWLRPVTAVAAAAVTIVAALGITAVDQYRQRASERDRADRLNALASAALSHTAAMPVDGGGSLAVVSVADTTLVWARDLPPLAGGRVYQFWFVDADRVRPAGTVDGRAGTVERMFTGVGAARGLAVTVEPAGGSAQPTTRMLVNTPIRT
jgi:hypothetical protein